MIGGVYFVVISAVLACFLILHEWKRKNRTRLFQRCLLSVVAVGSLLFLSYPRKIIFIESPRNLIVLTEGYSHDSISQFLHLQKQSSDFFITDHRLRRSSRNLSAQVITNLDVFTDKYKDDTIHVFGVGFTDEELDQLHGRPIIFHAAPTQPAITSVYWRQQIKEGEPLIVQGQFENSSSREKKLMLKAFNEIADSVVLPANSREDFSLRTFPRHLGKAVYSLAIQSGDSIEDNPIPVDVTAPEPLKILFLGSSPDFENTYLKNTLALQGYPITTWTTISKNKSDQQYLNMPEQPAPPFAPARLDQYDVIIASNEILEKIGSPALSAIRSAIEEKGMGLIVKMGNEKSKPSFFSQPFPAGRLTQKSPSSPIALTINSDLSNYKLRMDDPTCIRYEPGTQVLLQDDQSHIFASCAIYGKGTIVATTLTNTFSMALSGRQDAYQSLWSSLLRKAAKKTEAGEILRTQPEFSFINRPLSWQLETDIPDVTKTPAGHDTIYLRQSPVFSYRWDGTYWPLEQGWQILNPQDDKGGAYYVYNERDWQKTFASIKLKATKNYEMRHPVVSTNEKKNRQERLSSYVILFFLLLFIISNGLLWIEQKSAGR